MDKNIMFYKTAFDKIGISVSMDGAMNAIKSGKWRTQIEDIRRTTNKNERKIKKNTLPAITVSGLFSGRGADKLTTHSGFIAMDFDSFDKDVEMARGELEADKYSRYVFTSCGGVGICVIVAIDGNRHAESFDYLSRYYKDKYHLVVDEHCKNVDRLRFVSFDEYLFKNENSETVMLGEVAKPAEIKQSEDINYYASGQRDNSLNKTAWSMLRSNMPVEFVRQTLRSLLLSWGEANEKWIEEKIKSAMKSQQGDETLEKQVNDWLLANLTETNTISIGSITNSFACTSRPDKKIVADILNKKVEEGVLVPTSPHAGVYRKKVVVPKMDLKNITQRIFDVSWPLNIGDHCLLTPKNVAIIAGAKSAGKSAMALNLVKLNMDKHNVTYVSSEMAEAELEHRLTMFKDANGQCLPISFWDKANFYFKSSGFEDMIDPDGLNIVDFIEIHDNFSFIAHEIKKIFDKLNNGVAIICIQKKYGAKIGRGAEFSLEKSRLYIALDFIGNSTGRATIVDVKRPKNAGVPARGWICDYKLFGGNVFYVLNDWHEPTEAELESG